MPDQEASEETKDEKVQVWAATSSPNDFLKRTEEVPGIPYEFVFHSDYLKLKDRLEAEVQKWVDENNLLHMDKSELLRDIATLKKEVEGLSLFYDRLILNFADMEKDLLQQLAAARKELEGLRSFKESVDEALNFGDGSYRP